MQAPQVAASEPTTAVDRANDGLGAKAQEASNVPFARIVARRSRVYEDAGMHKPFGLVLFGAYVLGTASQLAGGRNASGPTLSC